jgi:hypothetical protein
VDRILAVRYYFNAHGGFPEVARLDIGGWYMTRLTKTETLRILAALIAGFVGGWIRTNSVPVADAAGKLIQAERIELINNNGKPWRISGQGTDNSRYFAS